MSEAIDHSGGAVLPRPMGIGEILSTAFGFYRRHWKTLLAIDRLEEDRFTFCAAYPGLERPTEFKTRPGQVLRISERERA